MAARHSGLERARHPVPGSVSTDGIEFYLDEISKVPLLSDAEERELAARARRGDDVAINELVAHNLRFVVSVAKRYQHRGLALDDLISEGNIGLIAAAHRFDPSHGVRFITYAVWWVRQAILLALAGQSRLIRIPASRLAKNARLARARNALRNELCREPSADEIAAAADVHAAAVEEWRGQHAPLISLDAPPVATSVRAIGDVFALDPVTDDGEDDAARRALVEQAIGSLRPREGDILRRYFGLDGGGGCTLDDLAGEMRVTRERIRQLRDRALGRLRHGKFAAALSYMAR